MNKKYVRHLQHMLDCMERISVHISNENVASSVDFSRNITACSAVERELYVITQCVKDIGPEIIEVSDEIPWEKVAWMRDVLAHHYFDVDPETLWDTITDKLPILEAAIRTYLAEHQK